jgi:hypothetical protein
MPRSYGWTRARVPCSHQTQSRSGGLVDCPIGNPVLPMSLASSNPHEHIGVDRLGARIIFWAMDLLRHGGVVMEAAVDGGVGVTPQVLPWLEHTLALKTMITCGRT